MKLSGIEVLLVKSRTIGTGIFCTSSRMLIHWHIVAMHKIDKLRLMESFEQLATGVNNGVPSHLWHFVFVALGAETLYIRIEYAQAFGIPFLRMATHQLHTDADSQYGLLQ